MSSTGYIQVHAYTSYAKLPLENVAITAISDDGTAIALRLTNRSGRIEPIEVPVPDRTESLEPEHQEQPFATVTLTAHLRGYEQVDAENIQVFAETTTVQNLEMIPLSELPGSWNQTIVYNTPPQNL